MATTLLAASAKSVAGSDSRISSAIDTLPTLMTNVSAPERWASLAAGTLLTAYGLSGKSVSLLSLLGGGFLIYRAAVGHCPISCALKISTSDSTAPQTAIAADHGTKIEHEITIMKSPMMVYRFWRRFENLPRFMTHLSEVTTTTMDRSHWIAKGPLGLKFEWDAEILTDVPNRIISWRSLYGSDVDTAGSVRFDPVAGGRGTLVRVSLKYDPPGGQVGTKVAEWLGESPAEQIREELERLKQLLERGN